MSFDPPPQFNLADHLLDARLAEGLGGRTAIRTATGVLTYQDVVELSARTAHVLGQADVRPEERVIVALRDSPAFVGALFGVLRSGAVAVMVNSQLPPEAIRFFLEHTRATAVFVDLEDRHLFEAAMRELPRPPKLLCVGDREFDQRLASASPQYRTFASHRDDPAIWLFSGGTTGRPKAVIQTHGAFANTTELYGKGVLGFRSTDITIAVPKLFFGYATGANLFFPFSVGASCVLFHEHSTATVLFDQIRRHRPSILIAVPTMVQQMVSHPGATAQDLSSLRLATSAGEALPIELHQRWERLFGVELLDGLGTAEMWHIFISNRPGNVVPGTLGHVVPGFEVKLCDEEGRPVSDGEVGALWVRGRSRAIGYWQRLEDTMRAFQGEWYVSGDLLRRNQDGTFSYCGRADDMLKVGGRWVTPIEIENCLLQHPSVREVAVVGVKNADGLVKPAAFVVADKASPELARELQEFVKARLEPYKYPREVHFLPSLPRTHLGKADRNALASLAASR